MRFGVQLRGGGSHDALNSHEINIGFDGRNRGAVRGMALQPKAACEVARALDAWQVFSLQFVSAWFDAF